MSPAALTELFVVEYAQGVSGPFCAKALAGFGADVVKVEPPEGDRSRRHGPFPSDEPHPERSGQFIYLNAIKRSAVLDLTSPPERGSLLRFLGGADVFIVDLLPQDLERLGLTFRELSQLNPRLIVTAISPFGHTGPYRAYRGTDLTSFHAGGLGWETPWNEVTDPATEPPLRAGGYLAEYLTGWTAAAMTMVALAQREVSGAG